MSGSIVRPRLFILLVIALCATVERGEAQSTTQAQISPNSVVSAYQFQLATRSTSQSSSVAAKLDPGSFGAIGHSEPNQKSGVVAALLSLAIPGLGEYYVGDQIWRGAIFTVLEGGLWIERYHFIARGDDSTTAFRAFGDAHWSPQRYANHLDSLLAERNIPAIANGNDFNSINRAEDTLNVLGFPDFTHRLPITDRQQYYELISKYIQFTRGWDDAIDDDPTHSQNYQRHADMRASMNYQYEVAQDYLYGVFLNHILSAIDAALIARDHNAQFRLHGELIRRPYPDGTLGYVPTAAIDLRF